MANPKNYNDTTPAAKSDRVNVEWQGVAPDPNPTVARDVSACYKNQLALDDDVVIATPLNDQVLTFETSSGKWKNKAGGGGGGGAPSGSPIILGVATGTSNNNWSDFTIRVRLRHTGLLCVPNSWKARLMFTNGTGVHISKACIKRTLKNSLAVVDTTNFTFNSGSMPYNFNFGLTASTSAPVYLDSDAIAIQLDIDHDYWIYLYFDNDSAGSNFNSSVGFNQTVSVDASISLSENHTTGDQTGDTSVPSSTSTSTLLVTQVFTA